MSATDEEPQAFYQEFKPSPWQRFCWWQCWPWRVHGLDFTQRTYGQQPYIVMVRENGVIIGWHPVGDAQVTTGVVLSKWSCIGGLFAKRTIEISVMNDPVWHPPSPKEDHPFNPGSVQSYDGQCQICGLARDDHE